MTQLVGMTWNHPRGYDPMVATSEAWAAQTGVTITWEKRSLQDFEMFPVEELAQRYDLIVIDHPHVGEVTAKGCLAPLDHPARETELAALAAASVGGSFASYTYAGRQWAFPIDAAAQVMAYRPDLGAPPASWDEVVALARQGKVVFPLLPPHSLMSFFTLCANLGKPCNTGRGPLVETATGLRAIEMLAAVASHLDPADFAMDPITASELLAEASPRGTVMPLGYGYVSYAINGFRPYRLQFADIPLPEAHGSALGGTGIAVSAYSKHSAEAMDYAYWVASAPVQSSLYAASGGQPGNALAWEADAVNAPTHAFYRGTRATLDRSYVRPRHHGYMAFQDAAARRLTAGLQRRDIPASMLADIERLYAESL
jgi:multiple sugar transport system substrate-binding protein